MTSQHAQVRNESISDILSPSSGTSLGGGARSTALSSRITTVLSTSYADLDFREALETLDARGFENTQDARRNFRLDLQQEVIACNGDIIDDFGKVAEQLKRVGDILAALNKTCGDMRAHIEAASRETDDVLEEATSVMNQKVQVETKRQLLDAFQKHFLLTAEESAIIYSADTPVDEGFFEVMAKVERIHQDSELLLGTDNERLGLEILEQSSKQLNTAFQKLYRWIQKEFKTLDLENPQIGSKMRRAIRVLAERPQLFQSCMDSFAENRERILSDAFHAALTGSATDSDIAPGAKPIDFQAHDPLRYVSDMLAWAHSATVSEREALEILFIAEGDELARGLKAGRDRDPWSRSEDGPQEVFDGRKALNDLVSRDIAGVGRLLRQRIERVLTSHEDAALAYKIMNLLAFYKRTFTKLLGSDAAILPLLSNLAEFAFDQFCANMRDHVTSIQPELSHAPQNMGPPEFLEEALDALAVLMKSFDSSMAAASNDMSAFAAVLAEALDPFLAGCEAQSKHLPSFQRDIFLANCITLTISALRPFHRFTAARIGSLQANLSARAASLTDAQYRFLLSSSGLEPLIDAVAPLTDSPADLRKIPMLDAFSPDALAGVSQELDDFLPSALMDAMDNLKQLNSASLVREITEEAAERFCSDFEKLEAKILASDELREEEAESEEEGEDARDEREKPLLRDLLPRTSGEIRVLLQ